MNTDAEGECLPSVHLVIHSEPMNTTVHTLLTLTHDGQMK